MITTTQVEDILDHFDVSLSNYEIVNIDEKKGWSAKHLYLIVEKSEQFILKGKSEDQLAGYLDDISISNYLLPRGFSVREPIKTHKGSFHHVADNVHWDLKTYIPAAVLNFSEYNEDTVESLAFWNTAYIKTSLNDPSVKKMNLKIIDFSDATETIDNILLQKDILRGLTGGKYEMFLKWFDFAQNEVSNILSRNRDFSIIHNDLNNKNILIDLESMKVVSFIDWDHGCIATPLKDIIEPINMFYDFAPKKYNQMRHEYIEAIKSNYPLNLTDSELGFLQVYFYALNKWNYITTFARLISTLGNTTNELASFEDVIRTQTTKLVEIGKRYGTY